MASAWAKIKIGPMQGDPTSRYVWLHSDAGCAILHQCLSPEDATARAKAWIRSLRKTCTRVEVED